MDCGYGAGTQWGNITGGHKVGKNVLAVANLNALGQLVETSSRGPAADGRIKPDISAHGQDQLSTAPENTYDPFGGTSSAAPTAASSIAQLYQGYRNLHAGNNPDAGLIKAAILNTADDLGNAGPDFKYGWGLLNAYKAYQILSNNFVQSDSIAHDSVQTHVVQIPPNIEQGKIMLYWTDPAAAANSSKALVNDLDLIVRDPSSTVHFPYILDTSPDSIALNTPATTGVDTLNNMEQVVIQNPGAGNYTIEIRGSDVPIADQPYYLVWFFEEGDVQVTYPYEGEGFVPGEDEIIRWDAFGESGSFDLEYSVNNGANWTSIVSGVNDSIRSHIWTVPNESTKEALIRVIRGAQSGISGNFTILTPPSFSVSNPCHGGLTIDWGEIQGSDRYTVYLLGDNFMDSISTTTDTNYSVYGLPDKEIVWASIASGISNRSGRRALAKSILIDNNGICPVADLRVKKIDSPSSTDRTCSGTTFSSSESISVVIENIGNTSMNNISMNYSVNGEAPISENIPSSIASGDTLSFTFSMTSDLSANSTNTIAVWLEHPSDEVAANDTLIKKVIALNNDPVVLPFHESFENLEVIEVTYNESGFCGMDRLDFETSNPGFGRLRTYADFGFPQSGQRALTLDASVDNQASINYAIVTLNLMNYTSEDLIMNFSFMHHGEEIDGNDRVWIRGSNVDPWLEIYDFTQNLGGAGNYKETGLLNITSVLDAGGQTPSCTFQVRFGQEDDEAAIHIGDRDGITIDDLEIKELCRIRPEAFCQQGNVQLDNNGEASFDVSQLNNNSVGCPPFIFTVNGQSTLDFTCADIGTNSVTVEMEDENGLSSSCSTSITVSDQLGPNITCFHPTVQLDSFGRYIIQLADVFDNAIDNCGTVTLVDFTRDTAYCSDIGEIIQVTVTAQDNNGNMGTCISDVTVEAGDAGLALCSDNTVSLSAMGIYEVQAIDIFNENNIFCDSITLLSFSLDTINCGNIYPTIVSVESMDNSGNSFTCESTLTVDNLDVCPYRNCSMDTILVNNQLILDIQHQEFQAGSIIQSDARLDGFLMFRFLAPDALELKVDFEIPMGITFDGILAPCD